LRHFFTALVLLFLAGCTPSTDYMDPLGRYQLTLPYGWSSPESITPSKTAFVHRGRGGLAGPRFDIEARQINGMPDLSAVLADWTAVEEESGLSDVDVRGIEPWTCGSTSKGVRVEQVHVRGNRQETAYQALCYVSGWRFHLYASSSSEDWGRFRGYFDRALPTFKVRLDASGNPRQ